MMRLVVEDVGENHAQRRFGLGLDSAAVPFQRACDRPGFVFIAKGDQRPIQFGALGDKLVPVFDKLTALRVRDIGRLAQVKARQPDAVGPVMWLSVAWIEPKNAPRSSRRASSDRVLAASYRLSFCQRL